METYKRVWTQRYYVRTWLQLLTGRQPQMPKTVNKDFAEEVWEDGDLETLKE